MVVMMDYVIIKMIVNEFFMIFFVLIMMFFKQCGNLFLMVLVKVMDIDVGSLINVMGYLDFDGVIKYVINVMIFIVEILQKFLVNMGGVGIMEVIGKVMVICGCSLIIKVYDGIFQVIEVSDSVRVVRGDLVVVVQQVMLLVGLVLWVGIEVIKFVDI